MSAVVLVLFLFLSFLCLSLCSVGSVGCTGVSCGVVLSLYVDGFWFVPCGFVFVPCGCDMSSKTKMKIDPKVFWTPEKEEMLVELWETEKSLFATDSADYHNRVLKEKALSKIAQALELEDSKYN